MSRLLSLNKRLIFDHKYFLKDLRPDKLPCALHRDEYNLGDIFLGVEYVMKRCEERSTDFHGTLTVSIFNILLFKMNDYRV